MIRLLNAFDRAHHNAVMLDQSETISNGRLDEAWRKSNLARLALIEGIERLETAAVIRNDPLASR